MHKKAAIIAAAAVVVVALTLGLSLGLTLPVQSIAPSGEVTLLTGERYTEGLELTVVLRSGKEKTVPVTAKMISGYDPTVRGLQDVTVTYKGHREAWQIRTLGNEDVTLRVRKDTLQEEYEPNDAFSTSGIFDLYYNDELFRSVPITTQHAEGFSTKLSGEFDITLTYREGLGVPYHYTVLDVVDHIIPTGVLYAQQGVQLGKDNVVGNLSFHVVYKDGTERDISVYDAGVLLPEEVLVATGQDYEGDLTFNYKGVDVSCSVLAYAGELLAPKSITLDPGRMVYAVGEEFDYSQVYVEVEFERFSGEKLRLSATPENIVLLKTVGEAESVTFVPDEDQSIRFDQVKYYFFAASYKGALSDPVSVRVINAADKDVITDITTVWRGRRSGPPLKGYDLELEGETIKVEYGYGYRSETVPLDNPGVAVTGYDKNVVGPQDVTVTYKGFELVLHFRVGDPDSTEFTRIIGIGGWNEETRYSDDDLVIPKGAYLLMEVAYGARENAMLYLKDFAKDDYEEKEDEKLYLKDLGDGIEVKGFTPKLVDPQTLEITHQGFTVTLSLTIVDDRVPELDYIIGPSIINVTVGKEIDYRDYSCTLGYNTGYTEDLTFSEIIEEDGVFCWGELRQAVIPYDKDTAGTYYFYIEYNGKTTSTIVLYVNSEVVAPSPERLYLDTTHAKTTYAVGDTLTPEDLEGMNLYLVYSDGSQKDITESLSVAMFHDFTTTDRVGEHRIAVTSVSGEGDYTTYYEYTVE